jgi:hypothetical protein
MTRDGQSDLFATESPDPLGDDAPTPVFRAD